MEKNVHGKLKPKKSKPGELRSNGEPWFVAKDVCEVLGIAANNVGNRLAYLDKGLKGLYRIQTLGGSQRMSCVNESGVYMLIMRSDKPSAIAFQNWIANDVLPSIRKHGMYMTEEVAKEAIEDEHTFLARALVVAMNRLETQKQRIEAQEKQIEEAKPIINKYTQFLDDEGYVTGEQVAKNIVLGRLI